VVWTRICATLGCRFHTVVSELNVIVIVEVKTGLLLPTPYAYWFAFDIALQCIMLLTANVLLLLVLLVCTDLKTSQTIPWRRLC